MFKIIASLCLTLICSFAFAGAKGGFNDVGESGIITPDIATGMRSFGMFNYTTDGYMAVCEEQNKERRGGVSNCTKWSQISEIIPAKRTFVGFKIVSGSYGYREIEIYWK